jgi:hypothetical protein
MKPLECDNVGFLYYPSVGEEDHPKEWYRRFLMCRQYGYITVEAESFTEAILNFYKEYPGASVGGPLEEQKAVWIVRSGGYGDPILKLPKCALTCWECDDDWIGYRIVCGRIKCHQDCIYDQGGEECHGHPQCGMDYGDFDCEGCPASQELYPDPIEKKTYRNPNPVYNLEEITSVNGLPFRCVTSPVEEYV